jgi:DNA-binding PadR family transcriptional regulator
MKIEDVYGYFGTPPSKLAPKELAIAYVAHAITNANSYGTALIQDFEGVQAPGWLLQDVTLYAALKFLEASDLIEGYWLSINDQPRPRRMYKPVAGRKAELRELGELFSGWKIKNIVEE